jgi:hypothetical protein
MNSRTLEARDEGLGLLEVDSGFDRRCTPTLPAAAVGSGKRRLFAGRLALLSLVAAVSLVLSEAAYGGSTTAVSWWPGEGNAMDVNGRNNGSLVGSVSFASGKVGQAFDLGGEGYVAVPSSSSLNPGYGDFTIDFWMKTVQSGSYVDLITKRPICDYGSFYNIRMDPSGILLSEVSGGYPPYWTGFWSGPRVNDGSWHHVALVRAGSTVSLYVDGVQTTPTPVATAGVLYVSNSSYFLIGSGVCGTATFRGQLDEIEYFNSALTQAQIQAIIDSSAPKPAAVALSPSAGVNDVGTSHTVTATVTDAAGQPPVRAVTVRFSVTGSVTASGSCTTDAYGQCSVAYTGPQLPGADSITAYADTDNDGVLDTDEPVGEATKAWVFPTSTPGQVSGGGTINDGLGNKIAFGFSAKSTDAGLKGNCNVIDHAADLKVDCTDVTSLVRSGNHATIFGNATVNGVATTYRIDVADNAETGSDADAFSIQTGTGYSRSGVLSGGNVLVR